MKRLVFICVVLMLSSCRDKAVIDASGNKPHPKKDSAQTGSLRIGQKVNDAGPIKTLVAIVSVLDSLGYSSDTARVSRLKNYPELLGGAIVLFGKYPFYKMPKEESRILSWNNLARESLDSIDTRIFNDADDIWAYFYQKKESPGLTVDGIIEQWSFADQKTAQAAMGKLKSFYPLPFFNTEPYYTTTGSFLFVFHTRASAFGYRQKQFFDMFKKKLPTPG